jgi:hypothetical protein
MGVEIGRQLGMPLATFIDEAYAELAAGKEQIFVGTLLVLAETFHDIVDKRITLFNGLAKMMRGES